MKKKKVFKTILIIFIVMCLFSINYFINKPSVGEKIGVLIADTIPVEYLMDKKEKLEEGIINDLKISIRKRKLKSPLWDENTITIWENMYKISGEKEVVLSAYSKNLDGDILKNVRNYGYTEDKIYIISDDGYAVINEENICKMYILLPQKQFKRGYEKDENGNRISSSKYVRHKKIIYLNSFEEFSKDEQIILKNLSEEKPKY